MLLHHYNTSTLLIAFNKFKIWNMTILQPQLKEVKLISCNFDNTLREKRPNTELFLVRIFLYSDWIRKDPPCFSVFGQNTGKYGPEITPYLDTFHPVIHSGTSFGLCIYNTPISKCSTLNTLHYTNWLEHSQNFVALILGTWKN